ncbi:MAG TPA: hypothetical protein VF572_03780 [Candidatus Saccharimonadales bacterium]
MTIPQEVLTYIATERGRGLSDQAIRELFAAQQWPAEAVEEALSLAGGRPPAAAAARPSRRAARDRLIALQRRLMSDAALSGIFRGGFAFIFLINGVIAWIKPADFIHLLESFPVASMLGFIPQMVMFTGLHDVVLGLLILSGKWQKYVLAWAGLWLSLVTVIKLVSLM